MENVRKMVKKIKKNFVEVANKILIDSRKVLNNVDKKAGKGLKSLKKRGWA